MQLKIILPLSVQTFFFIFMNCLITWTKKRKPPCVYIYDGQGAGRGRTGTD